MAFKRKKPDGGYVARLDCPLQIGRNIRCYSGVETMALN
jgi:hypothetical protein